MSTSLNLLGVTSRVQTPFVKVSIGDYTFGVFEKQNLKKGKDEMGVYRKQKIKYPNFIQALTITKINGQVNKYILNLTYPITQDDDPNFFEKVFSSVSKTRAITFSYGDMSAPSYIYRDEKAIITKIDTQFNVMGSQILYTINAISTSAMAISGAHKFASRFAKPSDVIKELLDNKELGLLEVFPGMANKNKVQQEGLIPSNDVAVEIGKKINITVMDYLTYLVSCMTTDVKRTIKKRQLFGIVIVDDVSGEMEGPYFKIKMITKNSDPGETYQIDIGFPSKDVVTAFATENNQNYSIFYDYQQKINDAEYTIRINDQGELEEVFAPVISSGNEHFDTNAADENWWTRVTEFPISANITVKGLLRPAILMSYVRLNVLYYGRRHISSGLYVVTAQEDKIDFSGYFTRLKLLRVDEDNF